VCVSALPSVGLTLMAPARRDITCSRAGLVGFPPPRRYPDRSRACVRIGAAQRGLDYDGASAARHQLLEGGRCPGSPPLAVTLIAHMLVYVSALPSVGLTLMAPARRDIS